MGGGPSVQTPECSCSGSGILPWEVYEAAMKGHVTIVTNYLNQKGNVNALYKGETLLHAACSNGREKVVDILLKETSLCVNLRDNYNETPLMKAAANGYIDCVRILLITTHRCPLDIYCKNNYENSAIDIAHLKNHQEVAYYMAAFLKKEPPAYDTKY